MLNNINSGRLIVSQITPYLVIRIKAAGWRTEVFCSAQACFIIGKLLRFLVDTRVRGSHKKMRHTQDVAVQQKQSDILYIRTFQV